jgi:hypothetical protein
MPRLKEKQRKTWRDSPCDTSEIKGIDEGKNRKNTKQTSIKLVKKRN